MKELNSGRGNPRQRMRTIKERSLVDSDLQWFSTFDKVYAFTRKARDCGDLE
jgi:hypothetical protein